MKLFAAQIATSILNNMGIDALRDGSVIKMRHAYVIVDDVCFVDLIEPVDLIKRW